MRRKGEFSPQQFEREYPFQLAFPESQARDLDRGAGYYPSHAPRTSRRLIDGVQFIVIGFAVEADAEAFQRHAGGVRVPAKRGRWTVPLG